MKPVARPVLLAAFCLLFFGAARIGDRYLAQTQTPTPEQEQSKPAEKQAGAPPQEYREFIKDEREALAKQAEQHFTKVNNLFDRMIWALTIFATFLLGGAGWWFWKTRDDFRKEAHGIFQAQMNDAIAETRAKLEAEVALVTGYKNRKIAWVIQPGKPVIEKETNALERFGLQNLAVLTPKPGEGIAVDPYELVILSYDDGPEDRRLLKLIIEAIKHKSPAVWLLVYTYNPNGEPFKIHPKEVLTQDFIKDFYWYVPAMFPATLVSQTLSLARFFGARIQ